MRSIGPSREILGAHRANEGGHIAAARGFRLTKLPVVDGIGASSVLVVFRCTHNVSHVDC